LEWSEILKAKLTAIIVAATLVAPKLALAHGNSGPSPNLFAVWREAESDGGARQPSRHFGSGGDVVAEAAHWIGSGKFTRQPGPWCADAVSAWLERSGHRPLENRMASSALAYGPRLERPEVGALAVLGSRRGWASHVGVVSSVDGDGSIHLISGNWGRRVAEAVVSRGSVIAFVAVR
jgi:uncharacterized protein (TIGR02594 family)